MTGQILTEMQDQGYIGVMFLGHPGAAKTAVAKAAGNEAEIPTIQFDLGAMKGSLVGESSARLRAALKTVRAVSQGSALFIATCLSGDTMVQLADGSIVPIREIGEQSSVTSFDTNTGLPLQERVSAVSISESNNVVEIRTSGLDLKATTNHTFIRWSPKGPEECFAGNLKVGNWLASPRYIAPYALPISAVTQRDLAWLLGYTAGDGNQSANRMQWSEQDESALREIGRICLSLFREEISLHRRKSQNSTLAYSPVNGGTWQCLSSNYPEVCVTGQQNRSIPASICRSDNETVASFLSGLFDADGSVESRGVITLTVTSKSMRDQAFILLQRLGITATCGRNTPESPRLPSYRITICGEEAVKFSRIVGFKITRKQDSASLIAGRKTTGKRGRCASMIPVCWKTLIAAGYVSAKHDPVRKANKYKRVERWRLNEILLRMAEDGIDTSFGNKWTMFDWCRIKEIAPVSEAVKVYDITVPKNHTFYAAGLVVHNCNSFGSLPPELRRRFTLGTFFFDLPTAEEREAIWRLYCAKYKIGGEIPEDSDWTGAEIRNCVDLAWRLNRKLTDAARFVVPLAQSAPEKIKSLRDFASGKFISAAHGGVYRFDPQARAERRALRLEDE